MVGAVLVQNTNWRNVERAIANLRESDLLDTKRILSLEVTELEELLRPAGYFRLKAKRLRHLLEFFEQRYGASFELMAKTEQHQLRKELLEVNGIGPETADSILLYALRQPAMVVDAYTLRVYARHGWVSYEAKYHELQEHLVKKLPSDAQTYNEFHALIVAVAKRYCRKSPDCESCPLVEMLPAGGVLASPCNH